MPRNYREPNLRALQTELIEFLIGNVPHVGVTRIEPDIILMLILSRVEFLELHDLSDDRFFVVLTGFPPTGARRRELLIVVG